MLPLKVDHGILSFFGDNDCVHLEFRMCKIISTIRNILPIMKPEEAFLRIENSFGIDPTRSNPICHSQD